MCIYDVSLNFKISCTFIIFILHRTFRKVSSMNDITVTSSLIALNISSYILSNQSFCIHVSWEKWHNTRNDSKMNLLCSHTYTCIYLKINRHSIYELNHRNKFMIFMDQILLGKWESIVDTCIAIYPFWAIIVSALPSLTCFAFSV